MKPALSVLGQSGSLVHIHYPGLCPGPGISAPQPGPVFEIPKIRTAKVVKTLPRSKKTHQFFHCGQTPGICLTLRRVFPVQFPDILQALVIAQLLRRNTICPNQTSSLVPNPLAGLLEFILYKLSGLHETVQVAQTFRTCPACMHRSASEGRPFQVFRLVLELRNTASQ